MWGGVGWGGVGKRVNGPLIFFHHFELSQSLGWVNSKDQCEKKKKSRSPAPSIYTVKFLKIWTPKHLL